MNERLSNSEKEKIKNKLHNSGEIPTSGLLEKLSSEISNNFGVKKNPGIYKESIKKLLTLENKINNNTDIKKLEDELKKLSSHLSEEKKKEFILAIKGAKEIIKNSRDLIENIKKDINIFSGEDGNFTTKLFGKNLLNKAKNPHNIGDEIIGGGIGLFNSMEAITKISAHLLIGIGKTIPDIYKIISGKGEYNGFKNM
ncbi:MAG: hypothetical protein Q9M94_06070 [Candidatus Gracilibacteria bacterium]|nr:hypothetical protein [Candidatus Gracilibacteria bacterium]MDQ7023172.1 hypothetical protein [Candidatus Gracilibacteria bacterium]